VLTGAGASERAFKADAPGHLVLHLATHGFFLGGPCEPAGGSTRGIGATVPLADRPPPKPQETSPIQLSGLALAGANERAFAGPDDEDGILTAEEIASLDLAGTDWAVLSACDTGQGRIQVGEGVLGLRRAFQAAGARTVIMSLWSVDDESTRQWMKALYENRVRKNLDTANAVREADLHILRARRAQALSTDPFYWAAFVATGDWR
jgi:CHAT domain-containing protein